MPQKSVCISMMISAVSAALNAPSNGQRYGSDAIETKLMWLAMRTSVRKCTHGGGGRCGPILYPELHKDLLQVFVHGARTDAEDFSNVAIGLAATDPQQHFGFARGHTEGALQQRLISIAVGNLGEPEQQFVGT